MSLTGDSFFYVLFALFVAVSLGLEFLMDRALKRLFPKLERKKSFAVFAYLTAGPTLACLVIWHWRDAPSAFSGVTYATLGALTIVWLYGLIKLIRTSASQYRANAEDPEKPL